ncbi:type VI secretion system lipoprotein TssJ [Vibrio sp. S4M6]|uniref:type VI secretion system lipoprotein TssJ n=1 Tax=Vibrio sinus TaxID=2946865 RepID=UPI002029EBC1|nr:type VI secretion system lipoprotein TssJ [Vibrio sinus]
MKIKLSTRWFVWLFAVATLSGCSSWFHSDPPPVPDQDTTPSTMTFSMVTTNTINPNAKGNASPVELRVFELQDDSMFTSASYDQLINDFKQALKSNFIKDYDYVVLPNHFKFVEPLTLNNDTRYIGVMAFYSDSDHSEWKKVVEVKPFGHDYHILIYLNNNDVTLERVQ